MCFVQAADLDLSHVMLLLQTCTVRELWCHGSFYQGFKEKHRQESSVAQGWEPCKEHL